MTGLFINRTRSHRGPGTKHIAERKKQARERLNIFADALADHGTVAAASRIIVVCPQRGSQLLARIRKGLGWQAQ